MGRPYDPSADRRAYDPELFTGTASYYRRFRSGYPGEVFDLLVERFELGVTTRVLDLGCGTGQLAIPLALRCVPVIAMDPDAEMLREGHLAAEEARAAGIDWRQGSSWDLPLALGPLRLAVMGRSFHWMDRVATLRALDAVVEPGGGVALVASLHREDPLHDAYGRAQAAINEIIAAFLGSERRAGSGTYGHPVDRHDVALANSPFSLVRTHRFPSPRTWSVDELVGLTLSSSYAAPPLFGDRLNEFVTALRSRLAGLDGGRGFEERDVTEVMIGTRPGQSPTPPWRKTSPSLA